jgi:serine/threonine protein kinase
LFDVYSEENLFGKIGHAKFYVGCITLGLEHMHRQRVIWRDLKLENLLMSNNGYVKLTDMGIAKMVIGKTYTVCGTADYFAPETLRQTGHNRGADWWALGVSLFIMMSGKSPFDAPTVTQIYKNIIKGFSAVKFPESFPSDLIDVVKSLCRKKVEDRVTMQKGGVSNLKEMPFFTSFKWQELAHMSMEAPYMPQSFHNETSTYHSEAETQQPEMIINYSELEEWDGGIDEDDWRSFKREQAHKRASMAQF